MSGGMAKGPAAGEQALKSGIGTDFTQGPIMPMLLRFLLPFLLANLLNSIYNMVDTIIIGQFVGSTGIVAVSVGGKMLNLFTNIGIAFAGGGQILISQLAGAKRREEYNATIGTMLTEMLALSVFFTVLTLAFSERIIVWLNAPEQAAAPALSYLRITCAGLPLIFGYNAISSVLRGMGDSKDPLIFIAIAAVVNLVGDLVLIGCFHMGAAGTAIATVAGQGVSLIFSVVFLYRKRDRFGFDFRLRSFRVDWGKLGIMLRLGLPTAVSACCITGTQLFMYSYVNLCGLAESAAYSIGDKVYHLANIFTTSVKQASGSAVGQNFGADRHDRVKKLVYASLLLTLGTTVVLAIPSLLLPRQIFGLFTDDAAVLSYAPVFMQICCLIFLLSSLMASYDSVVTGTGNTVLSMISGILDGVVLRIFFSFFFAYTLGLGIVGFFLGDALARCAPVAVNAAYYYSGAWRRHKKLLQ